MMPWNFYVHEQVNQNFQNVQIITLHAKLPESKASKFNYQFSEANESLGETFMAT